MATATIDASARPTVINNCEVADLGAWGGDTFSNYTDSFLWELWEGSPVTGTLRAYQTGPGWTEA